MIFFNALLLIIHTYESRMSKKLTSFEIQKRLPIGMPSTNENIYGSIRDCQVQGSQEHESFVLGFGGSSSLMIPS